MGLFSKYNKKTDEQLMILIQSGDHRAFSTLYDRYSSNLKAFFYRMLWSENAKAEDHLHDLFSKIIERPELFKSGYKVKSWLFQIAANMCKNTYRKVSFEQAYLQQLEDEVELPKIEKMIDEQLISDQVYQFLNKMEEDRKTLFLMRYQQEFTIEELSDIFKLPIGTVKSRLFHIRKSLLEKIEID